MEKSSRRQIVQAFNDITGKVTNIADRMSASRFRFRLQQINEAYSVLYHERSKRYYDSMIEFGKASLCDETYIPNDV
jgi:DnaJ-class molecular chaperone